MVAKCSQKSPGNESDLRFKARRLAYFLRACANVKTYLARPRTPPLLSSTLTVHSTMRITSICSTSLNFSYSFANTDTSNRPLRSSNVRKAIVSPALFFIARIPWSRPATNCVRRSGRNLAILSLVMSANSGRNSSIGWPDKYKPRVSFSANNLCCSGHGRYLKPELASEK